MDISKFIIAQQKIIDSDIDRNAKHLLLNLTIKANQYGDGFYLSDKRINKLMGLGENSKHNVINARKVLIERGLIEYERGEIECKNGKKFKKYLYRVNWDNIINIKY